jgi:serine/threonine-protein phosphatase PGAM5
MARTRIFLVRHGEQQESGEGLSPRGREQADRLGRRLAGTTFAGIHHSPVPRAGETAEIVGRSFPGVAAHACGLVTDRTPVPADRASCPELWRDWFDGVPAAERDEDAAALRGAVEHFGVLGDEDRDELLITHNFVIGWFVRHVMDAPQWRWMGLNQANCGLTVVQWESGRPPTLVAFNDTGHLQVPFRNRT